ncbi:MAG: GxxExxY protein [Alphaproteobacteria bacterium]|nr:GxxExxY protein [Alphaproteobacteria bacterium]MCB9795381.1 GxxExxY protein [Alphaproteobacteria bacterium]
MEKLKGAVIGAAIEVHRTLGPGLLESAYRDCLAWELAQAGLHVDMETTQPLKYKALEIQEGYRLDLLIEQRLIVELKAVDRLASIHEAQLRTYLRMFGTPEGLLINFNVPILKDGIRRVSLRPH